MSEKATFAGGCFWCMEPVFEPIAGVISVVSGYMGGIFPNPTYEAVCTGRTGHAEVVEITYDPSKISYKNLLEKFWENIDPTVENQQFCDVGSQYRSALFYHTPEQQQQAEESFSLLKKSKRFPHIFTQITAASEFYPAEDYHQGFYYKNPLHYQQYRSSSGRTQRLKDVWKKPSF